MVEAREDSGLPRGEPIHQLVWVEYGKQRKKQNLGSGEVARDQNVKGFVSPAKKDWVSKSVGD